MLTTSPTAYNHSININNTLNASINITDYNLPYEYTYNWYLLGVALTCSLAGSFSVFSLMYMIKYACEMKIIVICLLAVSIGLPIVSVWNLHFLCVFSMEFKDVRLYFNLTYTIVSMVSAIILNIIGFSLAFIPYLKYHLENYREISLINYSLSTSMNKN